MPYKGACLCGNTIITVHSDHDTQIVCHCSDCKQSSGSAFSTNILPLQSEVTIIGTVKVFDMKAASGNIVTRIFCSNCGSAISHTSAAFGEAQAVQTGNFREFADVPIAAELFVKDRWSVLPPIPGAKQVSAMV
ncbi:Mss4-like protein [Lyophyllum atratum]|nr:Mss4-like protein [Lyophyllum atratum]